MRAGRLLSAAKLPKSRHLSMQKVWSPVSSQSMQNLDVRLSSNLCRRSFSVCDKSSPVHTLNLYKTQNLTSSTSVSAFPSIRQFSVISAARMPVETYKAVERGTSNTSSYKVFVEDENGPVSPFHDVPLVADEEKKTYHCLIEIPRWTNAKMEIDTKSPLNPIVQDSKKGKLRYVANSFPHHGYIWNYGALPQTWESPNHVDESTGFKGDNDPVDVIEIGHRVAKRGDVLEVKVLGILAMIDDGETDWKVLCIDVTDPLADDVNSLEDVEAAMPGFLAATREWFRIYKIPDGKPENEFAFEGEFQDAEFAHKIIGETHEFWKDMVGLAEGSQDIGEISIKSVTLEESKEPLSREEAEAIINECDEYAEGPALDDSVDLWHYAHLK